MLFCLPLQKAVENESLADLKANLTGFLLKFLKTLKMSV